MNGKQLIGTLGVLAILGLQPAHSDPCGMVPPVYIDVSDGPGIERVGTQRTYVMFKDGVETMALRPGFEGDVDEFGMLIPFPSPPAIRKIDDDTFVHLEGAVDPPILHVQVRQVEMIRQPSRSSRSGFSWAEGGAVVEEEALGYNEVRVLREEAVGMYQVAVLEAGSSNALRAWMDENGYRYPDGMDRVANDYVAMRWCFVAVKAGVGQAAGVAPRPGMRETNSQLPAGSSFDGHVQGMGFRFLTSEPVIPMRLSVFNGEEPRNVIYFLGPNPVQVKNAPRSLVVRQVRGGALFRHLTQPISLEVSGLVDKESDLTEDELQTLAPRRDPAQYNRIARDLFAADLLAVSSNELTLAFEEEEKSLLNISESLGMRGDAVDTLLTGAVAELREETVRRSVADISSMTLTVIDGVLPHALIRDHNLTFARFRMPNERNLRRNGDIRLNPPGQSLWRH